MMRTLAEYDNFRKRSIKEKESMFSDGIVSAVKTILPILDNIDRALSSESEQTKLKEGIEMVKKQAIESLTSLGISEIECDGKEFDPSVHSAVMHVEDESFGENAIVEVFPKGYIYKDGTVIRHAAVKVAN